MDCETALQKLRAILTGINQDEFTEGGWWETGTSAEFGATKLVELERLITEIYEEKGT